eukprot:jgi/Undpi1/3470/HiC_scaffold_16.g06842.m1
MEFLPARGVDMDISFKGDTLIVPIVSTGNVGQLAVDLFLSSGRVESPPLVKKVGYLETELVAPAAGYEVFGPGQPPQLCVNLELHRFSNSRVTLLQQRGAVLSGEEQAFAAQLVEWSRRSGFKDILALTGADAAEGLDPTPIGRGGMKRFRAGGIVGRSRDGESQSPSPCALEEALTDAGIGVFDPAGVLGAGWPMAPMEGGVLAAGAGIGLEVAGQGEEEGLAIPPTGMEGFPKLPPLPSGTGVAGNLCVEASAAVEGAGSSPPLVVLLRFCSEGDNTPDAIAVAQAVNDSLRLLPGGDGGEGSPGGAVERAGVVINSAGLLRSEWREAGGMAAQRSVVLTCTAGAAPTCVAPCRW